MIEQLGSNYPGVARFCHQYFQVEQNLDYPDGDLLRHEHIQEFLVETMFSGPRAAHLPPPRYRLRVVKELVARIEKSIQDWDEHVG
jgi:hypothetical protein